MSSQLFAIGVPSIDAVAGLAGAAGRPASGDRANALADFETLFVETLLRQAGLARTLDGSEEAGASAAGELFIHQIASALIRELPLGLEPYLEGVKRP